MSRPHRRAFLGGAAALIGLPWLPSLAGAQEAAPPRRLIYWYVPNGMPMEQFVPTDTGPSYTLPPLLQSLSAHRDRLLVLSNLGHATAAGLGGHARGTAAFLTGVGIPAADQPVQVGPSADVLASLAPAAAGTAFPSLQLGVGTQPTAGTCDTGYACAYQNTLSWTGPTTPLPLRTDPVALFDTLFGGTDSALSEAEAQRRALRRASVLDHVTEEATALSGRLGAADRQKLDQYLTGVRELEQRLQAIGPLSCDPGSPPGVPLSYAEHVELMTELMVKAVICDRTRVLSFMADVSASNRSFDFIGIGGAHHENSHWAFGDETTQATRKAAWAAVGAWHIERFADLLDRLVSHQEADGTTLLDHCSVLFGSEIGEGHVHDHSSLPILLAGGDHLQTGQHHRFASPEPFSNVLLGMIQEFGSTATSLGDSTGTAQSIFS